MPSAKVVIKEQDRSAIVTSLDGVYAGIVITCDKGPVNQPFLITSVNQLLDIFGNPNPKLGVSHYSALTYLSQGNKLWVVRAAHADAKYAAALVRSKIDDIPQNATGTLTKDMLIVRPLDVGLTQTDLDTYEFPTYRTNKLYEALTNTIFEAATLSYQVRLSNTDNLAVGDALSFSNATLDLLNDSTTDAGENQATYTVQSITSVDLNYDNGILATPITAVAGTEIMKVGIDGTTLTSYANHPKVVRSATNSTNILIDSADLIANGDNVSIGGVKVIFDEKNLYTETAHYVTLDSKVTVTTDLDVFRVTQAEFEERDAFLVTAYNQGVWGKNITIGISPSSYYTNAFNILVYYSGVLVETWEVTRDHELDGFGRQMYLEQKINGNSAYILVKDNQADVDSNGTPNKPISTDYSLWRQDSSDVFVDTTNTLVENLLLGDSEVKLSSTTNLTLGTRIKFVIGDNNELSSEYKVLTIDAVNKIVTLDRNIVEDEIFMQWTSVSTGAKVTSKVFYFNATNEDSVNGIVNGIQYYAIKKISSVYYNYPLNATFIISGVSGTLLSAGANMLTGGAAGSTVTVGDLITGLNFLNNKEKTPVNLFMDGGFAIPAYAQAINSVCDMHGLAHGFLSTDPASEEGVNYLTSIVDYKNSLNLGTSHLVSIFSGWIKVYDSYNQLYVWVSPEAFGVAAQTYTTRNYNIFTPAAGWLRGAIQTGLDVKVRFSEGDRDTLVDARINPIRYKEGSGLAIWGNETILTQPSPMQLRSVAMLLIMIKTGLESVLEYKEFDLNNENTWSVVEGTIDAFMRDSVKAKGGVYDYSVAVKAVITDGDIDNRRMPVFLGIQPTMDIQEIPVTLAVYNKSSAITVSV